MKILYITTVGSTMDFFIAFIRQLLRQGHTVDIACGSPGELPPCYREWGCGVYPLSCSRSPLKPGNRAAVREIRQIVSEQGYDLVHCHTPVAAACTRLACRTLRKTGTKVYYTAHGFHFYQGAPLKNWLLYYPVEWLCSFWTDTLITINTEDYRRAEKHLHAGRTVYVPGVGVNTALFRERTGGQRIREELGIGSRFLLLSVGELNENKNHRAVIRAAAGMDLVYVIAGDGPLRSTLKKTAEEAGTEVVLPGYQSDIAAFYAAADAYILPSLREGLNVSLMEAMASGLPCLAGRIRGNTDLLDEAGGYLFDPKDSDEIRRDLLYLLASENRAAMGAYNQRKIRSFDIAVVNRQLMDLYNGNTAASGRPG